MLLVSPFAPFHMHGVLNHLWLVRSWSMRLGVALDMIGDERHAKSHWPTLKQSRNVLGHVWNAFCSTKSFFTGSYSVTYSVTQSRAESRYNVGSHTQHDEYGRLHLRWCQIVRCCTSNLHTVGPTLVAHKSADSSSCETTGCTRHSGYSGSAAQLPSPHLTVPMALVVPPCRVSFRHHFVTVPI